MHACPKHKPVRRAFTLVEVLLVLVILVIISSLAVTAYGPIRKAANEDAARAFIGGLKGPMELYKMHMGDFPQDLEGLVNPPGGADPASWRGPYVERLPLDPWKRPYQYQYPGQRNPLGPDIWSMGEDGQSGTPDDVGNWQ